MLNKSIHKRHILYHNYLFFFGFIYYLIIPLIVACDNKLSLPGLGLLTNYDINNFVGKYLICCSVIFISFYVGSITASLMFKWNDVPPDKEYRIKRKRSIDAILPFVLFGIVILFLNRSLLFKGYLVKYDVACIGQIASIQLVCLFMLVYALQNYTKVPFIIWGSVIVFSIALLGLGSRMYIMIPLVAIILYLIEYQKIRKKYLIIFLLLAVSLFLLIGIWRKGSSIDWETLLYIGLAEPCYTWIGAESLFQYNQNIPLFAIPHQFMSSFINFIPSILLPGKKELMSEITLQFDAPFGATSIIVSTISNFGIVGSAIFMTIVGSFFTYIRKVKSSLFMMTFYFCICGLLPFQFFRDGFTIINKNMFMNFLVYPMFCILLSKLVVKPTSLSGEMTLNNSSERNETGF